jgi:hypothetical protein
MLALNNGCAGLPTRTTVPAGDVSKKKASFPHRAISLAINEADLLVGITI